MDLRQRFIGELRNRRTGALSELSPSDLARAAAVVLGATGGALSLVQPLVRMPIGASDDQAWVAEHVQASVGVGPSLDVGDSGPLAADEDDLRRGWPLYHRGLTTRTPFRSTACFPLTRAGGSVFAALDLYSAQPVWPLPEELATVQTEVVDLMAMMLLGSAVRTDGTTCWPGDERARRRQQIWVAVGMLCEAEGISDRDAMALLRAYAFARDALLDDVADEMLAGRLLPEQIAHD